MIDPGTALATVTLIEKIMTLGTNVVWNAIRRSAVDNPTPEDIEKLFINTTFDDWLGEEPPETE